MRVDKFLKVSRILKRRSVANEAASGGRVKINGKTVKPSHEVKIGDVLELGFNSGIVKIKVVIPTTITTKSIFLNIQLIIFFISKYEFLYLNNKIILYI